MVAMLIAVSIISVSFGLLMLYASVHLHREAAQQRVRACDAEERLRARAREAIKLENANRELQTEVENLKCSSRAFRAVSLQPRAADKQELDRVRVETFHHVQLVAGKIVLMALDTWREAGFSSQSTLQEVERIATNFVASSASERLIERLQQEPAFRQIHSA